MVGTARPSRGVQLEKGEGRGDDRKEATGGRRKGVVFSQKWGKRQEAFKRGGKQNLSFSKGGVKFFREGLAGGQRDQTKKKRLPWATKKHSYFKKSRTEGGASS